MCNGMILCVWMQRGTRKTFFMKGDSGYRGDNLIIQGHERKDRKRTRRYEFCKNIPRSVNNCTWISFNLPSNGFSQSSRDINDIQLWANGLWIIPNQSLFSRAHTYLYNIPAYHHEEWCWLQRASQ